MSDSTEHTLPEAFFTPGTRVEIEEPAYEYGGAASYYRRIVYRSASGSTVTVLATPSGGMPSVGSVTRAPDGAVVTFLGRIEDGDRVRYLYEVQGQGSVVAQERHDGIVERSWTTTDFAVVVTGD